MPERCADLIVGAFAGGSSNLGAAYVYPGRAAGLPATPILTLTIPPADHLNFGGFGYSVE